MIFDVLNLLVQRIQRDIDADRADDASQQDKLLPDFHKISLPKLPISFPPTPEPKQKDIFFTCVLSYLYIRWQAGFFLPLDTFLKKFLSENSALPMP